MEYKRCAPCGGSGSMLGMGMMKRECLDCDGSGKIRFVSDEVAYLGMKQTEAYQNAKKRLQKNQPDLSDAEAESLLDEAFEKEKPTAKKGRSK